MPKAFRWASMAALSVAIASPAAAADPDPDGVILGAVLGNVLSGKTTVDAKTGEVEGWLMAAPLLNLAASQIVKATTIEGSPDPEGILLVGAEAPNISLVQSIETQAEAYTKRFVCHSPGFGALPLGLSGATVADAIGKAPAPSIAITSYAIQPDDQTLVNAIQGASPGKWLRLDDIALAPSSNKLAGRWEGVQTQRDKFAASVCGGSAAGKALVADFDALDAKLHALGDKGTPSLLDQAERIQMVVHPGVRILRVTLVKAGGSIINTDTLWTRLGFPAVRMTGALVVGYRLVDASSGISAKGGLIVCHAPKTSIGALHRDGPPPLGPKTCERFGS